MVSGRALRRAIGPASLLLLWYAFARLHLVNPVLLPTPIEVLAIFVEPDRLSVLLLAALRTLALSLSGFLLSAAVGTVAGIFVGWFDSLYESFELAIEFFRALPAAALLPPVLLFFGIGDFAKLILVSFACSLIVVVNTAAGVKNRNQIRTMYAHIRGATKTQTLFRVILPDALPTIVIGLRISASLALILTVVAEMLISTDEGLGRRIVEAQELFRYAEMYAAILIAGLLGFWFNKVLVGVASRFVHWAGR